MTITSLAPSPPSKRLHGTGYIKNNSRTVILTSSSDWVRPIFIFCKLQFKETDYACKVFKNVTIFISVSGKTLRVWHNRSMLVCVITERLWTKRVNVQRFLWPVSHGKTLSLASATNKYVSSLSWLWRLMRRSIRNFNIPKPVSYTHLTLPTNREV